MEVVMPEEIAGKTFYTPEEAAAAGKTAPTEEEIARAEQLLAEFQARVDAIGEDEKKTASPKFYDDTSGTEFDRRRRPPR
jgi:hypothetical protein